MGRRWAIKPTTGNPSRRKLFLLFICTISIKRNRINIQYEFCRKGKRHRRAIRDGTKALSLLLPYNFRFIRKLQERGNISSKHTLNKLHSCSTQNGAWLKLRSFFFRCSLNPRPMNTEEIFSNVVEFIRKWGNLCEKLERYANPFAPGPAHNALRIGEENEMLIGSFYHVFVCANKHSINIALPWVLRMSKGWRFLLLEKKILRSNISG